MLLESPALGTELPYCKTLPLTPQKYKECQEKVPTAVKREMF